MLIKRILRHPPSIANSGATIQSVSSMMRNEGAGAVIIQDAECLVGIVTDRDIAIRLIACGSGALKQPISKIMTPNPLTCFEDQDVVDAAVIMADHQVRYLPVMDHAQHVVGLLTIDVIAEHYSELLAGETLGEIVELRQKPPVARWHA